MVLSYFKGRHLGQLDGVACLIACLFMTKNLSSLRKCPVLYYQKFKGVMPEHLLLTWMFYIRFFIYCYLGIILIISLSMHKHIYVCLRKRPAGSFTFLWLCLGNSPYVWTKAIWMHHNCSCVVQEIMEIRFLAFFILQLGSHWRQDWLMQVQLISVASS